MLIILTDLIYLKNAFIPALPEIRFDVDSTLLITGFTLFLVFMTATPALNSKNFNSPDQKVIDISAKMSSVKALMRKINLLIKQRF
jgi:hypothetical protein